VHDFLKWQSSLSLDQVFSSADTFSYPASTHGCDGFFYLTQLKHDKSRSALMFSDGLDTQCVTPSPFSLRTKISEYGGKPYWLFDGELFFCNQTDQCLYRQTFLSTQSTLEFSKPQRISPKGSDHLTYMYSDVIKASESVLLVIVECEDSSSEAENKSYLATIDLNDSNCCLG